MRELKSLQHPLVKHLVRLRDKRSYRYEQQRVFIEGVKMVEEICRFFPAHSLMVTHEALVPLGITAPDVYIVSRPFMEKVSGVLAPEGIVAEVQMPSLATANLKGKRRVVACDGVSDPGNLGTLIRTALALGWEGFFILNNCCDPFNDKALRAAKGATFRLPLAMGGREDLEKLIAAEKWRPVVADVSGESPEAFEDNGSLLLVLGSESHGPSRELRERCSPVSIPMPGAMESLNVSIAGAILMYVLGRKL